MSDLRVDKGLRQWDVYVWGNAKYGTMWQDGARGAWRPTVDVRLARLEAGAGDTGRRVVLHPFESCVPGRCEKQYSRPI
jgi:hypothetical protein